jgi:hypothetical protein
LRRIADFQREDVIAWLCRIDELLSGKKPQLPLLDLTAFKKAVKEDLSGGKLTHLDL